MLFADSIDFYDLMVVVRDSPVVVFGDVVVRHYGMCAQN
jgi:hypothetical protein